MFFYDVFHYYITKELFLLTLCYSGTRSKKKGSQIHRIFFIYNLIQIHIYSTIQYSVYVSMRSLVCTIHMVKHEFNVVKNIPYLTVPTTFFYVSWHFSLRTKYIWIFLKWKCQERYLDVISMASPSGQPSFFDQDINIVSFLRSESICPHNSRNILYGKGWLRFE